MGKPAARLGDIGANHGPWPPTPIISGSGTVLTNSRPAARVGDALVPHVIPYHPPHPRSVSKGASKVLIDGKPAARVGHSISCGGSVATGSGNVLIGDSPKQNPPTPVNIPDIVFTSQKGKAAKATSVTPVSTAPLPTSKAVPLQNTPHTNDTEVHYEAGEEQYSVEDGALATLEALSSQEEFNAALGDTIASVSDPVQAFNEFQQLQKAVQANPKDQQGAAARKALAGDSPIDQTSNSENDLEQSVESKRYTADSLEDAKARLEQRREQIAKEGYQPKYSDEELTYMVQNSDIGSERFQVRFMEVDYLNHQDTPDEYLSGKMGLPLEGAVISKGAKYWSTSLDQLEDADTDPKLIAQKLGLEYDEKKKYALIIVDTEKSQPLTETKIVSATFKGIGGVANTELPKEFPEEFTDKVLNDEYQADYAQHHTAAKLEWEKDTKGFKKYINTTDLSKEEKADMLKRMSMHDRIGNNQHNLGNGLTKDLNSNTQNEYGVVETINLDRNEVNLKQLDEADAILILKNKQMEPI